MADSARSRGVRRKSFAHPDGVRRFPRGLGAFVEIGAFGVARAVLEPGWRWSTDVQPMVGTRSCEVHHVHIVLAGRFKIAMDDGEAHDFVPDDVMDIPPGHDAWVVGDEPVVLLDISGNVSEFALPASRSRELATILMTDIVGSTATAARIVDAAWRQVLSEHDRAVRGQLERFRGREIKTTGDGFLATFDSPGAALLCSLAVRDVAAEIAVPIRTGVHTGEIDIVGDDIRGIAVHATARVMAAARPGEVLTSSITRALAQGTGLRFEERGAHELKGLDSPLELLAVER